MIFVLIASILVILIGIYHLLPSYSPLERYSHEFSGEGIVIQGWIRPVIFLVIIVLFIIVLASFNQLEEKENFIKKYDCPQKDISQNCKDDLNYYKYDNYHEKREIKEQINKWWIN